MPPKFRIEKDRKTGQPIHGEGEYQECVYDFYVYYGFNALTRTALKRVLKAYLPDSIFEQLDLSSLAVSERMDLEIIGHNAAFHLGKIFEESGTLLDIYRSPEFLTEQLKVFCSFTNSFEELWEPHRNCVDSEVFTGEGADRGLSPVPRLSQRNWKVMTKQGMFAFVRNQALLHCRDLVCKLPCLMLTLFLKKKQREIESAFEHVIDPFLQEIGKEIEDVFEEFKKETPVTHENKLIDGTLGNTVKAFGDLLEKFEVGKDTLGALKNYFLTEFPEDGTYPFEYYRRLMEVTFDLLERVMQRYSDHFSPFDKPQKARIVRLFEDEERLFAIDWEMNPQGVIPHPHYWSTFSENERMADAEFLDTPIVRAAHRAVPIRGPDGKLCKLVIDFFLEMFDELTLGLRVFDSRVEDSKERVMNFLNELPDIMKMTEKKITFIREERYVEINQLVRETFADFRSAERLLDFSTVESLRELRKLCIASMFSRVELCRIEALVRGALSGIEQPQTADICRSIGTAVKIMVMVKNPPLSEFVHYQKGCHRILGTKNCRDLSSQECLADWIQMMDDADGESAQDEPFEVEERSISSSDESSLDSRSDVESEGEEKGVLDMSEGVLKEFPLRAREYVERIDGENQEMKVTITQLEEDQTARDGLLEQLRNEIVGLKAEEERFTETSNAQIEKLFDELKTLTDELETLTFRCTLPLETRRMYDKIDRIETGELEKDDMKRVEEMEKICWNEYGNYVDHLYENKLRIRNNAELDLSEDLLSPISVPKITFDYLMDIYRKFRVM